MTERQKVFIDAYIETLNASESARRAGYSAKSASVTASRLLANAKVKEEIERRLKEVESARTATLEETLEIMTQVLRGEMKEETVIAVGYGKTAHIEKVVTGAKIRDRLKAAEMLAKIRASESKDEPIEIIIRRADENLAAQNF